MLISEISSNDGYCTKCNTKLSDLDYECPNCHTAITSDEDIRIANDYPADTICPRCGAEDYLDVNGVCPRCSDAIEHEILLSRKQKY